MDLLIIGAGYSGLALGRYARSLGKRVLLTTRKPDLSLSLRAEGFETVCSERIRAHLLPKLDAAVRVVATHPPDPETDAELASWAGKARRVVRLSSTSVYGAVEGIVSLETKTAEGDPRADVQLAAEAPWATLSHALILRCAGIYGPDRGSHVRIARGDYTLPGDGSRYVSRIHVQDLAHMAFHIDAPGRVLLAADACPATHLEVATFVCERLKLPLPASVPLESVHPTLRGNRRVDASETHALLGSKLHYPSYREGLSFLGGPHPTPIAEGESPS
jgi:nucleoside-diphosphate-sugar epimerase